MGAITVKNVHKQFGSQIVLEDISLELHTGQTVGMVGPNGAGKTTLFKIIAGMIQPDTGTVTASKGLQLGYLSQEPEVDSNNTLHDEAASAFADLLALEQKLHSLSEEISARHDDEDIAGLMAQYDRVNSQFITAGGYTFEQRLNEILGGLGFTEADRLLPVSALSGGQKCRVALAKLLLQDRQYLLLDEPTNHLDIDAVRWLEKFLAGHHGGAMVISHDRYLLDRLADRIIEVDRRRAKSYVGNYTTYAKTKALDRLTQERQFEKDAAFIEKERAFIAKHMAGQRTKEAQGRRTRLERRLSAGEYVLEKPSEKRGLKLDFDEAETRGGTVLRVEGLAKRYDAKALFKNLDLQIDTAQRLGITGPNGTGKTTLLKILMGEVPADDGEFEFQSKADIGYYAQDALELDADGNIIETIRAMRPGMRENEARSLAAQFHFTGDDAFKKLGMLSGGEQSRVRLMKLLLASPNVLILDEPTNHLDIGSREALEEALADFPGTIIAVSHDRYFLDRIVDRLLVIRPEGHRAIAGNYSAYIETVEQQRGQPSGSSASADTSKPMAKAKKGKGRAAGSSGGKLASRFDSMSINTLESMVIEREERLNEMNARFADPAVYRNAEAMADLREQVDALKEELREVERAWSERVENL
jgi:ATP-binding cassette subfamily F protein 3